jgi:hypothetical protein
VTGDEQEVLVANLVSNSFGVSRERLRRLARHPSPVTRHSQP